MDFGKLKEFSDRVGAAYGSEDLALFLYALIKMQKPQCILELGTGDGAATVWMAQALKENKVGKIITVDNGSQYEVGSHLAPDELKPTHREYFLHVLQKFNLEDYVSIISDSLPPFPIPAEPIDLIFADFDHGLLNVLEIFTSYLPFLNDTVSIFVDSASTFLPSYLLLERLVSDFNKGIVPATIISEMADDQKMKTVEWVKSSQFVLVHLTTAGKETQNSTAWIKVQPRDIVPWPTAAVRGE